MVDFKKLHAAALKAVHKEMVGDIFKPDDPHVKIYETMADLAVLASVLVLQEYEKQRLQGI